MNLELWFAHVLYSSFIASLMVILLLVMKKLFPNRFSARFVHMLWILILIRLLMPLDIENPLKISSILPDQVKPIPYQEVVALATGEDNVTLPYYEKSDRVNESADYNQNLLSLSSLSHIWLAGLMLLLLFSAFITIRFKHRARDYTEVLDLEILALVEQGRRNLDIKKSIPVYMHSSIKSPCIAGVIKPRIYLPEDICTCVHPYQLEHVILHELAHYKRRDLICNLGAIIAAILHWFNPLVWLAVREMRNDREMASDAYVMEILGERGVIPYGMTIINIAGLFANRSRQFNLVSFNETHSQVERRVNMIKNYQKGSYKISLLAILVFILIGVVTLTTIGSVKNDVPSPVNESIQGQLVLINPAHGGKDSGATYPSNFVNPTYPSKDNPQEQLQEKDLNLDIALKLKAMLEQSGIKVALSRQDDRYLSLDDRVAWANQQDAALLVNIHYNNTLNTSTNGTMTYYQLIPETNSNNTNERTAQIIQDKLVNELETKDLGSEGISLENESSLTRQRIAQIMQAKLVVQLGTTDLGSRAMRLKMLNEVPMPAVSPQIAFLSNESDREKLKSEAFRIKTAQALHDGIIEALTEMQSENNKNQAAQ